MHGFRAIALVAVGGALGTTSRFLVSGGPWSSVWATVVINVVGCALMGLAASRVKGSSTWWPLVGPGFLGGFTTFSAFELYAADSWVAVAVTVLAAPAAYCLVKFRADQRAPEVAS